MIGIVLCGGQSSRMGSDKGLLEEKAVTWAQHAFEKLQTFQFPVLLSVNREQYSSYTELFSSAILVADNQELSVKGPLLGVLSTHLLYPTEDIFVLACDMPLMDSGLLKQMMDVYQQTAGAGAIIFSNEGEPEPLCGIYRHTGLEVVMKMLRSQQLLKHSMKFMLDHINPFIIPLDDQRKKYFRNFNTQADLNRG